MAKSCLGCTTTVDIVQKQQYTVTSLPGVKRSLNQIDNTPDGTVLKESSGNAGSRTPPKRLRYEALPQNRLEASCIDDLNGKLDGQLEHANPNRLTQSLAGNSQNPLLSLSHPRYSLPVSLVNNLAALGIKSIYPWQSSCLLGRGLLEGKKNLVYTAPTGGGKSLVADVLMLKRVIDDPSKKAIMVLPYVALVQEKLTWLRKIVENVSKTVANLSQPEFGTQNWRKKHDSSVRVVGFFGGSKVRTGWADVDIAICTIEKVLEPNLR